MSAINFPNNPAVGDTYDFGQYRYRFDGQKWATIGTGFNQGAILTTQTREALRRSYAEAGFTLVAGSFELGGRVTTTAEVLLYEADGRAYSWDGVFPVGGKVVPPASTPTPLGSGGWIDRTDVTLRGDLATASGASHVGTESGTTVQVALNEISSSTLSIASAKTIRIGGRRANQILQLKAPPQLTTPLSSGVSQGIFVDETTGETYITWDGNAQGVGTIIRKLDSSGAVLGEWSFTGLGHADSISKYVAGAVTGFLIGNGDVNAVSNFTGSVISASYPVTMPGRVLGSMLLVAVNQYDYQDAAFFYRLSDNTMCITHGVPIADILAGTAVGSSSNTFTITTPTDASGEVVVQSIAYYGDTIIVWAGNDSRSGMKLLSTYDKRGNLLERVDVQVDRLYADNEGNITEPEGLSISKNSYTGGADIHIVKCFGYHDPAQTIIRVYELCDGQSDNAIWMEGQPERIGATYHPLRVCNIKLMLEKSAGGWVINVGGTQSPIGSELASNVRYDVGGNLGVYFDLYKPYIALIGFATGYNASFSQRRVSVGVSASKGGPTSNKDVKITFFNVNTNAYISANDGIFANGDIICVDMTVGFYK